MYIGARESERVGRSEELRGGQRGSKGDAGRGGSVCIGAIAGREEVEAGRVGRGPRGRGGRRRGGMERRGGEAAEHGVERGRGGKEAGIEGEGRVGGGRKGSGKEGGEERGWGGERKKRKREEG